jgi:hypothetical protein
LAPLVKAEVKDKRVSWERYGFKSWIEAAARRLHPNKLAIALANKLARLGGTS